MQPPIRHVAKAQIYLESPREVEGMIKFFLRNNEFAYIWIAMTKDNVCPGSLYRVILSVLDPRKCEYLKDYSLDFEHAYMTTYIAS